MWDESFWIGDERMFLIDEGNQTTLLLRSNGDDGPFVQACIPSSVVAEAMRPQDRFRSLDPVENERRTIRAAPCAKVRGTSPVGNACLQPCKE